LIVDNPDPNSPSKDVWNHWLVWDIPPSLEEIPEAWNPEQAVQGQNDYAEHGYGGPNPTEREQTYRFRLYALNTTLGLPSTTTKSELVDAVLGNILDKTQLEGRVAP
jgi:Raf kinase inhibitor-like YbhB/YbcL family protein